MMEILTSIAIFVTSHMKIIELIVFWYPIIMGMLWVIGSVIYYFRLECKDPLPLNGTPMVSVLVPAYNEAENIENTIKKLNEIDYPNYEIIIINDGSSDDSAEIEKKLAQEYEKVRLINLLENSGKANALYLGLIAAKGEYLVCVDGDSYLDKDCIRHLVAHFLLPQNGERVGAVTGNPRVRNRSSLLSKLQLCEYASIISLIKRTQRIWGKVMTVSGVVVAYRKRALLDCGLWDRDLITEDIGVTWKLERNFWDVRYEPRAICWMLVPETVKGIIKQRKRWAQGGQEVLLRHFNIVKNWDKRRMFPILFEQIMSTLWVILWLLLTLVELFWLLYDASSYYPYLWKSQFLAVICICQMLTAALLELKYDKQMLRHFAAAAWYPLIYWIVNGIVAILAIPATIKSRGKKLAVWSSPDRGLKANKKKREFRKQAWADQVNLMLIEEPTPPTTVALNAGTAGTGKQHNGEQADIITGRQKWWKKVIEILITVLAWAVILIYLVYCIYGFIMLGLGRQPFEFAIYTVGMLQETKHMLFIAFVIFLIEVVFMIFWKEYNRIRFGRLNRRRFQPDVTRKEVADYFFMHEEFVQKMQEDTIVTLKKNIIPEDFEAYVQTYDRKK